MKLALAVLVLVAAAAVMAVTDDCRQPGSASFKLNKVFDLAACGPR